MCSLYVLMVTTDESSLSFISLGSIFWGQTTCMMDEYMYTFKWLPTSLQCIPPWNMSMAHSQYLLFRRNSGIVNTGFSELSLYIYMGVRHTV